MKRTFLKNLSYVYTLQIQSSIPFNHDLSFSRKTKPLEIKGNNRPKLSETHISLYRKNN